MSFLNPVNEPVLRFKSTDAGAPQINYDARVAGDVKAVLKACLVTGYGTTTGAGWTVANDVAHVAEFVSPSAAMSDYRFGVDDTSASSTTWYYQYQDVRNNPRANTPAKAVVLLDSASAKHGWQLLVTSQGFLYIEYAKLTSTTEPICRVVYFMPCKSALASSNQRNISFFAVGMGTSPANSVNSLIKDTGNTLFNCSLADLSNVQLTSANKDVIAVEATPGIQSNIDTVAPIYLHSGNAIVGELPAVSFVSNRASNDLLGIRDVTIGGRPALYFCLGYINGSMVYVRNYSCGAIVHLDSWEY